MTSSKKNYLFEPFKITEVKYRGFASPRPRSGHRIACDDVKIYCFGGYNPHLPLNIIQRNNPTWTPGMPLFKELWSFTLATKKWKQHIVTENMPEELASNAMCMSGKYLMVMYYKITYISCKFYVQIFDIECILDIWWHRSTFW